jgi:hypothetical protein
MMDEMDRIVSAPPFAVSWLVGMLLPMEFGRRALFRDHVESRLAVHRQLQDIEAAKAELARSMELQGEIWTGAVAGARDPALTRTPPYCFSLRSTA